MSDPRLYEWIALRRVHDGGMAKTAGIYLDHGRRVSGQLTDVLDRLIWTGLINLAAGDPLWEQRRLSLTPTGLARYTALSEQRQQITLTVPPAQFGAQTGTGAGEGGRHRDR